MRLLLLLLLALGGCSVAPDPTPYYDTTPTSAAGWEAWWNTRGPDTHRRHQR